MLEGVRLSSTGSFRKGKNTKKQLYYFLLEQQGE